MYRITMISNANQVQFYSKHIIHDDFSIIKINGVTPEIFKSIVHYRTFDCIIDIMNHHNYYSRIIYFHSSSYDYLSGEICIKISDYPLIDDYYSCQIFKYLQKIILAKDREWYQLDNKQKYKWLRACSFYTQNPNHFKEKIVINGAYIQSKYSFLCEFGEKVLGVGGYFGSNLDAFDDCLGSYYQNFTSLKVIWNDFEMYDYDQKDSILEILHNHRDKVQLII